MCWRTGRQSVEKESDILKVNVRPARYERIVVSKGEQRELHSQHNRPVVDTLRNESEDNGVLFTTSGFRLPGPAKTYMTRHYQHDLVSPRQAQRRISCRSTYLLETTESGQTVLGTTSISVRNSEIETAVTSLAIVFPVAKTH